MEREHCINKETGYDLWSILIYLSTSSNSMFKLSLQDVFNFGLWTGGPQKKKLLSFKLGMYN